LIGEIKRQVTNPKSEIRNPSCIGVTPASSIARSMKRLISSTSPTVSRESARAARTRRMNSPIVG